MRLGRKPKTPTEVIELNRDVALSEAASTLGRAGDIASNQKDTDGLLQVAAGWLQLAHRLDPVVDDGVDSEIPKSRYTMGFSPMHDETRIPEGPNPDVED